MWSRPIIISGNDLTDIPAYFSGTVSINENAQDIYLGLFAILKSICERRVNTLKALGVNCSQWLHKISLCAYAIVNAILSIPKPIGGRILTIRAAMRQFDRGTARIKQGLKETGANSDDLRKFENQAALYRQEREIWLRYVDCLPNHGRYGREQTAVKRIFAVIYYHLGFDICQGRIIDITQIYDCIRPLVILKEVPDTQFFRNHLALKNREKLKTATDVIKAIQDKTSIGVRRKAASKLSRIKKQKEAAKAANSSTLVSDSKRNKFNYIIRKLA